MFSLPLAKLAPAHLSTGRTLPSLDGVRGLAVLLVVFDHMSDGGLFVIPGFDFNRAGHLGVLLFFSLSAFLLTFPFFTRPREELVRWRTWGDYAWRRILRIFPLYALVLVATCWRSGTFTRQEVLNHLFLLEAQRHFWTVLVEVKYYFVLPLFVIAVVWLGRRRWWLGAVGLAALWVGLKLALPPVEANWVDPRLALHRYLQVFLLGSLAGCAHGWMVSGRWEWLKGRWFARLCEGVAWGCLVFAIAQIPALHLLLFRSEATSGMQLSSAFAVLWSLLLLGHLHGTGALRKCFSLPILRGIGIVSYSVYLWHPLFLETIRRLELPVWLRIVMFLGTMVPVAALSFWFIERPLSRLAPPRGARDRRLSRARRRA